MQRSIQRIIFCIALLLLCSCGGGHDGDAPAAGLIVETARDQETGIPVRSYYWPGAQAHAGYFNTPLYTSNGGFYFVSDSTDGANLYLYSAGQSTRVSSFKGKDIWLDANIFGLSPVESDGFLFYSDGAVIYRVAIGHAAPVVPVFSAGAGESIWAPLHVTRDGQFLSVTLTKASEPGVNYICRIQTLDGARTCLRSPLIGTDKPYVDHAQIHPYNSNLIMFAHDDSWVRDRIWEWNIDSNLAQPRWLQPELTEVGHEFWDGRDEGLVYAVQYGQPAYSIPSGLIRLDAQGEATLIGSNTIYYLAHASMSPDRQYFAADTYRPDAQGRYWLVLYDLVRNEYTKITPVPSSQHPAHAHPSWSPSGDRIMFTALHEGVLSVKEVRLDDVLSSRP